LPAIAIDGAHRRSPLRAPAAKYALCRRHRQVTACNQSDVAVPAKERRPCRLSALISDLVIGAVAKIASAALAGRAGQA
jgi:hypothetical protein